MKATWNGVVIAESDETKVVEGNHYFPPTALKQEYFKDSPQLTTCPWKGVANYYTITVNGADNPDAAWTYLDPSPRAAHIKDYVAFWRGVTVSN